MSADRTVTVNDDTGTAAEDTARRLRQRLRRLIGGYRPTRWEVVVRRSGAARADVRSRVEIWTLASSATDEHGRAIVVGPNGDWRGLPAVLHAHAHGRRHGIGAGELIESRPAFATPLPAESYAAAGMVALSIDMPHFGARWSGDENAEAADAKAHLWRGDTLFGRQLRDLGGGLTLLSRLVGHAWIGVAGLSMGATHAFWLAALDRRVRAVVQMNGFADLATLVESGAHDLHGQYMIVPGLIGVARTGEIAGLVAPRPQWIGIGLADPLTPEPAARIAFADVEAAYAVMRAPTRLSIAVDRTAGHAEQPGWRAEWMGFLTHQLTGANERGALSPA
jgi:hypothetical protein